MSNSGLSEADARATEPLEKQKAQLQLAGEEIVLARLRGENLTQNQVNLIEAEPYLQQYMGDRLKSLMATAMGPEIRDFMRGSTEERITLLRSWEARRKEREIRLAPVDNQRYIERNQRPITSADIQPAR